MPNDLLQTADGDLQLVAGDVVWGNATIYHQRSLLLARKYDYRRAPGVGVDSESFIGDDNDSIDGNDEYFATIRREFTKDGMKVKSISANGKKLITDAKYKD